MNAAALRQAKVAAVLNLKGGVGKTHVSWLIASVCQERSLKVLLIDIDTQGNLSNSFVAADDDSPRIEALFDPTADAEVIPLTRHTEFSHIDIIPADSRLIPFDLADQDEWRKADLQFALRDAVNQFRGEYDYIVIDCPPRLSLVSIGALCASDGVVIPLEAADWGAQGIMQVTQAVEFIQQKFNPDLNLLGYVVSRFKRARAYQQSYVKQLREHFGELAFDTEIPDLAKFEKSVTDRIPITLHAPSSEEASIARQFFDEVDARAKRIGGRRRRSCHANVQHSTNAAA